MDVVSSITALSELKRVSPDLHLVQFEEATLLGAPLFINALPSALDVKIKAWKRLTSNLDFLHAHDALYLLKNCLAIPKLLHVLHCSPTWKANDQLLAFDEVLRRTLESVCNIKMDGDVWSQATLPTSTGSLGIRRSQDLAVPAFLSSTYASSDLVHSLLPADEVDSTSNLTEGMDLWRERSGKPLPSEELCIHQRVWDEALVDKSFNKIFDSTADPSSRGRLLSVATKESGAWLNVLPSPHLGTKLDDDSIRIATGLRLGAKIVFRYMCMWQHRGVIRPSWFELQKKWW